jgi:hypothetical protein
MCLVIRVRQRRRFLYGKILLRVLVVDSPSAPFSDDQRKLVLSYTLDAVRLLERLGREWAAAQNPRVRTPICRFTLDYTRVTISPLPAPPLTGNMRVDIATREAAFLPSLLTQLGLPFPLLSGVDALRDALVDDTDTRLDSLYGGCFPDDVATLVVTTAPLGWPAYATPKQGLAVVNWDEIYASWYSIDHTIAHELGHVFGALDEYTNAIQPFACAAADLGGALQAPNDNCQVDGSTDEICLMRQNQPVMCPSTLRQVGWEDWNEDGIMDLSQPPEITGLTVPFPFQPRVVNAEGPGTQFATRVFLNGSRDPDDAYVDPVYGLCFDVPPDLSGPITVEVRTPTGRNGGDPGGVIVII